MTEPKAVNADGEAMCVVRWIVETPGGWLGAYDKEAFDAYASAANQSLKDCRTCVHFRSKLHCDSLIVCDGASQYKATGVVRLWDRTV